MKSTLFKNQSDADIEALWFSDPFIYNHSSDQNLSRWEILQAAQRLSLDITSTQSLSAIVLFQQRHIFLIASLAIALKKGRVILPPNTTEKTLKNLQNDLPNLWLFGDKKPSIFQNENHVSSQHIEKMIASVKNSPPPFCFDRLTRFFADIKTAEIWLYTSGSTGLPKRVVKTWQNMIESANLAISRFNLMTPCFIVTTVPNQHMFGLETSIFWPFFSKASLWHDRPMFPEDIISALSANTQQPALLVSTPLHIKKLIAFKLNWPKHLNRLLSATAPMPIALAKNVEEQIGVQVFEVYGSTETASIASKQSTLSELWQPYHGVEFQETSLNQYAVKTAGLELFQPLNDQIELNHDQQFMLGKRDSDLIKVAGKRASLTELNQSLRSIEGIYDGVFIQPEKVERLSAFIVSSRPSSEIRKALRKIIDPAFLPRPIIFLNTLPRNDVGKILYNELLSTLDTNGCPHKFEPNIPLTDTFFISAQHPCLAGHFPDNPIVPGVILLEKVEYLLNQKLSHWTIEALNHVKFLKTVLPEERIKITINTDQLTTNETASFELFNIKTQTKVTTGKIKLSQNTSEQIR